MQELNMRVIFLGVGEACDESLPNTSLLCQDQRPEGATIMLDCGFSVPPVYWNRFSDPNILDAIWISHCHGDHFFGLPQLLLYFLEKGRTKSLYIVCAREGQDKVLQALRLAYDGLLQKIGFDLKFEHAEPGRELDLLGLRWEFAQSRHPESNLALSLQVQKESLYFSGDGGSNDSCLQIARGCTLMVHEAYTVCENRPGHSNVLECLEFARQSQVLQLALVHMQRGVRRHQAEELKEIVQKSGEMQIMLPEPGHELWLNS